MAQLEKVLSYRSMLLITINSIMGTGIFFLPAIGAGIAGPASIISWLILSVVGIYISMCFGELASMYPKAGGIYEFCKQAYGRFFSFIIGWATLIAANITIAMLVVGAIQYLLPLDVPLIKLPASIILVLLFNFVAYRGMRTSGTMLVAFSIITLTTVLLIIIPGFFKLQASNFSPFFVAPTAAVFVAVFFIAETFFGWETATFLAAETKDGARVMPKVLIISTVVISILALLLVIVSLGTIPWNVFGASTAPFTDLTTLFYGSRFTDVFTILVYIAIIGSVAGWIVSAPRLILAMAEDKLFPYPFAAIHEKYKTPYKAIAFQTILTIILVFAGSGNYKTLVELLIPIVLVIYSFTLLAVPILRFKQPDVQRYFRVPFGKIGPVLLLGFMGFLIFMWLKSSAEAFRIARLGLSFIALGLPVYLLLQAYYNPRVAEFLTDFFAVPASFFEKFTLPFWIRNTVIREVGDVAGKNIFEVECGFGTLTKSLAKTAGGTGKLQAMDISHVNLKIAAKRLKKFDNVELIHHHEPDSYPSNVNNVDAVLGVTISNGIVDIDKALKNLNRKMKMGARLSLLEYDNFFFFIPNDKWVHQTNELSDLFKKHGFEVQVEKKRNLLWTWVFIYGKKVRDV